MTAIVNRILAGVVGVLELKVMTCVPVGMGKPRSWAHCTRILFSPGMSLNLSGRTRGRVRGCG